MAPRAPVKRERTWRSDTRSTTTWRRSGSSPSRSASTGRSATGTPTLASRVAEMLGVSRASAGEMLKRLEADGLVARGEHKEALLTRRGASARRRSSASTGSSSGCSPTSWATPPPRRTSTPTSSATPSATTWSSGSTRSSATRTRCPHGWPVDPELEQRENRELDPARRRSRPATGRRSSGSPSTTVSYCTGSTTRGSCPGTEIEVRDAQPAAGQLTVGLNGDEREVGERAAAGLFVRRA